eukprot:COSAG02_NODE_3761_length_6272_cov_5.833468_7_plen_63_part_00
MLRSVVAVRRYAYPPTRSAIARLNAAGDDGSATDRVYEVDIAIYARTDPRVKPCTMQQAASA